MKRVSAASELRVIVSILDGSAKMQNRILSAARREHFGTNAASEIFDRIQSYARSQKPIPTVRVMATDNKLSVAAKKWLSAGLSKREKRHPSRLISTKDVVALFERLDDYRKQRAFYEMAKTIAEEIEQEQPDHEALMGSIESGLMQARSKEGSNIVHAGVGSNDDKVFSQVLGEGKRLEIIPTGLKTFDEASGGFGRTNLVFVSANYGGGKSVMGMQLAINMYHAGYSVLLVSLEMDENEVWERIWSNVSGIEHASIHLDRLTAEEKHKLKALRKDFHAHGVKRKCRFSTYHPGYIDPWELCSEVRAYAYDVLVIDYIGLMKPPPGISTDERIQLGEIAKVLKIVSGKRYMNCLTVCLAQLNDDNRLKYSRAMAEHANNVMWWRVGDKERERGEAIIHQDKARASRLFDFLLKFDFACMRMTDGGIVDARNAPTSSVRRPGSDNAKPRKAERVKEPEKRKKEKEPEPVRRAQRGRGVMSELTKLV